MKEILFSENGVSANALQTCPVCSMQNASTVTHCKTCDWLFAFKNHSQYDFELSRAKRQFQLLHTYSQVLHQLQTQGKLLEKIDSRLTNLENKIVGLKEDYQITEPINLQQYEYAELPPIRKVADFDTTEKRQQWWDALEVQWQKAYNQGLLSKGNDYQPTDEELNYILTAPTLRLVGPKAIHASIDFELTNLSGLKHLTNLTMVAVSHNAITNLAGIEHLENLTTLFVNANALTQIKAVHYLPKLTQLHIQVNQIKDLQPIHSLTTLETLYCSHNCLTSLAGITQKQVANLKILTCLPNDDLPQSELERMKQLGIHCKKG